MIITKEIIKNFDFLKSLSFNFLQLHKFSTTKTSINIKTMREHQNGYKSRFKIIGITVFLVDKARCKSKDQQITQSNKCYIHIKIQSKIY